MKRMFSREFVICPETNKFMIFNYPTKKGKRNRMNDVMCSRVFIPTRSSWNRVEQLLWRNKYPAELAIDEHGEMRFVFSAGESLT